jgi:hypothetical protein
MGLVDDLYSAFEKEWEDCLTCQPRLRPTQTHVVYPEKLLASDKDRLPPTPEYCQGCGRPYSKPVLIKVIYEGDAEGVKD